VSGLFFFEIFGLFAPNHSIHANPFCTDTYYFDISLPFEEVLDYCTVSVTGVERTNDPDVPVTEMV